MSSNSASSDASNLLQRLLNLKSEAANTSAVSELTAAMLKTYTNVGKITVQLAQMIYDSSYISDTISNETGRIAGLDKDSRKNIYKIRQLTLMEGYHAKYYKFVTNVMVFTCFVTMLCLTVGAALRSNVIKSISAAFIIIGIILVIYTLGMMFAFSTIRSRTKGDWDQYYFRPSKEILDASKR